MTNKQYVWLVRYGLTEHQLIENHGPYDSDIHPTAGVEHARAIATAIATTAEEEAKPSFVYSDPFLRCTHTASIIAQNVKCAHRIEEGVTEWLVPSLLVDQKNGEQTHPRGVEELQKLFSTIDASYKSVNPVYEGDNPPKGSPHFVETEQALYDRVSLTLDRLFKNHMQQNESICIVSHAPCLQGMALTLEGKKDPCLSSFGPWSLGGITRFSRESGATEWTCDFYSSTQHMPGEYKDGIKGAWSLPSFVRK
jgi:broad specificity phosphatase PhoE